MALDFSRWMRRTYRKPGGYWWQRSYKPYKKKSNVNYRLRRLERGVTGKETKKHDLTWASTANVTSTGDVVYLSGISQGTSSLTRDGLKINIKSIWIKGFANVVTSSGEAVLRIILFIDKMNLGANPSISSGANTLLEATTVNAFREHQSPYRFKILWDKVLPLSETSRTNGVIKYYKKFKKGLRLTYTADGSSVSSAGKNAVFIAFLSNKGANYPTISGTSRITFTD